MPVERALVAGAGGFVGRAIAEALADAGYAVTALDMAFDEQLTYRFAVRGIDVVEHDLSRSIEQAADVVVHAAAVTASPDERSETPEANLRANIDSALTVSESFPSARRMIFISSSAVFPHSLPGPLTETTLIEPLGTYPVAKALLEQWTHMLRNVYQRDVIAVRLGPIYGPHEYVRSTRPRLSLVGEMLREAIDTRRITIAASPAPPYDWTYSRDVGRAIGALLWAKTLSHSLYHLTSEQVLSTEEIAQAIARVVAVEDIRRLDIPVSPGRGVLTSERLQVDTGFDDWTPFEDALREMMSERQTGLSR